jgi:cytochrome b involved in lipid metabolism
MSKSISVSEISQHNKADDVWIVVDGKVYNMTTFAPDHPGGADSTFMIGRVLL